MTRCVPYSYCYNSGVLNFRHNNQSMADLWGANFRKVIAIARCLHNRWYGSGKFILGERGFDFDSEKVKVYYGG